MIFIVIYSCISALLTLSLLSFIRVTPPNLTNWLFIIIYDNFV